MTATRPTIAVVSAGLSEDASTTRLAQAVAKATREALEQQSTQVEIVPVNLRDIAHGITDMMLTGIASPDVRKALDIVVNADGLIAASPTYKASYSGLFKSFFDLLDESALTNLPTVVLATGGTPRHSLVLDSALRPLMAYLKALTLPVGVYAAAEDWGHASLQGRIDTAGRALAAMIPVHVPAEAAGGHEPTGASVHGNGSGRSGLQREVVDEFSNVPNFADLLSSVGQ